MEIKCQESSKQYTARKVSSLVRKRRQNKKSNQVSNKVRDFCYRPCPFGRRLGKICAVNPQVKDCGTEYPNKSIPGLVEAALYGTRPIRIVFAKLSKGKSINFKISGKVWELFEGNGLQKKRTMRLTTIGTNMPASHTCRALFFHNLTT